MINIYIRNDKLPSDTEPIKTKYHTVDQLEETITEETVTKYFQNPDMTQKPTTKITKEYIQTHTNTCIDGFPYVTLPHAYSNTWKAIILYLDEKDQIQHIVPTTGNICLQDSLLKHVLMTPEALQDLRHYKRTYGLRIDRPITGEIFGSQIAFHPDEELITDHLANRVLFLTTGNGIQWNENAGKTDISDLDFLQEFTQTSAELMKTVGAFLPSYMPGGTYATEQLLSCFASQISAIQDAMVRYGISPNDLNRELQRRETE